MGSNSMIHTIKWRDDWQNAPRDGTRFLVLRDYGGADENLVTTAFYHYETACAYTDGYDAQWYALHDAVRDEPLDDGGPPDDQGFFWAELITKPSLLYRLIDRFNLWRYSWHKTLISAKQ